MDEHIAISIVQTKIVKKNTKKIKILSRNLQKSFQKVLSAQCYIIKFVFHSSDIVLYHSLQLTL